MKYVFDNDMHLHSKISLCSDDPEQTNERILSYAKENGVKVLCLTNHFWDETIEGATNWYQVQNYEHIAAAQPLPQCEGIRFLFGCEVDMDKNFRLGIARNNFDKFDFVVVSTTHLHMTGFTITDEDDTFERRADLWVKRFEALLNMDLPFEKIGIAHLACNLIAKGSQEDLIKILNMLKADDLERLFSKAAKLGCGIELNLFDINFAEIDEDALSVLRIYKIAKKCGCKFYFGSDAHNPCDFDHAKVFFERAIDLLELTEDDKFRLILK